ncbi:MAG: ABC transporter ATP-binding protein [Deltaproteobacteria bacterium]|nr:ABC transporter ATP-binding protein [Deltaproteobacteria bacterium]
MKREGYPAAKLVKGEVKPAERLKGYFWRYRWRYALGFLFILATNAFATAFPWGVQYIIDGMRSPEGDKKVGFYSLVLVAIAVGAGLFRVFSRIIVFNAGRDIEYEVRNELFDHLQKLPPSFYQRYPTGDLMSRLTNDLGSVRLLLGPGLLNLSNTPIIYLMTLGAMAWISLPLTLCALIPLPFFVGLVRWWSREYHQRSLESQQSLARLSARIQENLNGAFIVKLYAREAAEVKSFNKHNRDYYETNRRMAKMSSMMTPVVNSVPGLGILLVLFFGGRQVMAEALTLGQFVTFILYIFNLSWPTFILGWVLTIYQRGLSAMGRLSEILDAEVTISPGEEEEIPMRGEIEFRNLTFHYPSQLSANGSQRPVALSEISLRIPPGSLAGIAGGTGAGKSTLVELIPHFFEIPQGALFVEGRDITTFPLQTLRRQIGYAPQEAFLFSTTIAENIALGLPQVSKEKVEWAAEVAGIREEIESFPMGMQTIVGERGVMLSGGQRQRIALARAIAMEPKILILDDSLSSVDAQTERKILDRLKEVFPGKTVLIISHRLSALEQAGMIFVLKGGRLIEAGTPEKLLRQEGYFAELARRQRIEEELEKI